MAGQRKWSVLPSTFMKKVDGGVVALQRRLTIEMLEQITIRAPVLTGRFKANNLVSVGEPVFYSVNRYDLDGNETLAYGEAALAALVPYSVVYIQNNLIYAGALEDGHSGQAPAGVYGVSYYSVLAKNS
ncbi:HK97 gp10 family phage protein [Pseudomonas sp. PDM19]|uniref:HK97 gp10 family phage protein n=1 Tax=Pseudomonas sp. PDM19 TaxID=2769272 RepID=UPI00177CE922|nr:HK97 gp10 family phage protein [Pseudomonas sp. PDM19]MBD9629750.1 HK97 gp10 family phage protein [Pseudomonas sp. PDM19]